jgi:hypothetical protein
VRREDYYAFWLPRFSIEELKEMAHAIWGPGELPERRSVPALTKWARPQQQGDGAGELYLDASQDVSSRGVHGGVHHTSIRDSPDTSDPHN